MTIKFSVEVEVSGWGRPLEVLGQLEKACKLLDRTAGVKTSLCTNGALSTISGVTSVAVASAGGVSGPGVPPYPEEDKITMQEVETDSLHVELRKKLAQAVHANHASSTDDLLIDLVERAVEGHRRARDAANYILKEP